VEQNDSVLIKFKENPKLKRKNLQKGRKSSEKIGEPVVVLCNSPRISEGNSVVAGGWALRNIGSDHKTKKQINGHCPIRFQKVTLENLCAKTNC
jgi:hypothetical protein